VSPIRPIAIACTIAMSVAPLQAQENDGLPTEHVANIPPGGFVDLDSGLILPGREYRSFKADLRFDRDGAGFYLEPLLGGLAARPADREPADDWATGRIRIDRHGSVPTVMFVRTDRGVARVELLVADPYSTASAMLRWVVVPPTQPVFLPPPQDLEAGWVEQGLAVTWRGECSRWLVEVQSDGKVRKETTGAPRILLDKLDRGGLHRIRVRGLSDGNVSMPADVVQYGKRRPPERGVLQYGDQWYDRTGGMRLSTGSIATEDAEVVFYLYGVSVPGGGVLKMGSGSESYAALSELPSGSYPPIYGRIDDNDVLAVQLPDGRFGKLWLEPAQEDVRSGMRVHFTFLADGRRRLLARPSAIVAAASGTAVQLRWQGSPEAVSYRVSLGTTAPVTVQKTEAVLQDLKANQVIHGDIVAIDGDGGESDAAGVDVVTYPPEAGVRHGRCTLEAQRGGYVFASDSKAAEAKDSDFALVGGAGGSAHLRFNARGGAAAGGQFAFGEFPDAKLLSFDPDVASDVDKADTDRFYVRTADGGMASVRIVERGWPRTVLEYVWLPKR
jgi:hypothetical protein